MESKKIAIANPPLVLAIGRLPGDDLWGSKVPAIARLDQVFALDRAVGIQLDAIDVAMGVVVAQPRPARRPYQRHERGSTIDALTRALKEHFRAARDHAYSLEQRGRDAELLPRPTMKQLAEMIGVVESSVSRAINDEHAMALKLLWDAALDLDQVLDFGKRRARSL